MYTTETVIKKFKEVHGEFYDYSKVNFIKTTEKVCIICAKHGEFWQEPYSHIKGRGCPMCGKNKKSLSKTYTTNEFIEKSKTIHGNKYDYSKVEYINSKKKVIITCPIHGDFLIEPNAFLMGRGCNKCGNSKKGQNGIKKEFIKFLTSIIGNNVILNFNIGNCCIDYYLPYKKIGFIFLSSKRHIETKIENHNEFKYNTEVCEKNGIHLIHIFEDEWLNKKEICKSRIINKLTLSERIYARKCNIVNVNKEITKKFLDDNHIQGNVNSLFNYGLEYNGELVSLMTFGKLRKNLGRCNMSDGYELLRFCNKIGYSVIGGASKLFNFFKEKNNPSYIVSYADRRWSNGNLYEQMKFTLSHISKPNYFYVVNNERKNRFGYRKDVLVSKYDCPLNETEHNFCKSKGWYRIYDCGTKVYEWKK
jgi:hypothetical protein